jgi:ABC-2 type transport system permease protein
MVFWTLIFPLILATFFSITLRNIKTIDDFSPIEVAVVGIDAFPAFDQTIQQLSSGDDRMFNLTRSDEVTAKSLLKDSEISGYILAGEPMTLIVSRTGMNQSILKNFLDQYSQNEKTISDIVANNPDALPVLMESMALSQNYIREVSVTDKASDPMLVYFYALIAMSCLYGSMYGLDEVNRVQASLSSQAARLNVAPVHKLKVFAAGMLAAILFHFSGLLVLLVYMDVVLGVTFGANVFYVGLILLIGSILGISMGTMLSAVVKKSEGMKVAVVLFISMLGSFLAGMMISDVKYYIAQKLPLLAWLNPANQLSDALYALYYYDTHTRLFLNLAGMSLYSIVFCGLTYFIIRGRKYASL